MNKYITLLFFFATICTQVAAQSPETVVYEEDHSVFANPERGFYQHTEVHTDNYTNLNSNTLRQYREDQSITQILRVFYLEAFREKPISAQYLNNMRIDFKAARLAGIKVIVRFAYTRSMYKPYNDATPEVVLMHIEQLKPILRENADVIAVVQTGFVGAWGEWYYTDHFAGSSPGNISEENWADRRKVVQGLLDALPTDRNVQIRTPGYKMIMFDSEEPLESEEAFSGSDLSRIGHHNDCFVASSSDFGTYIDPELEKPYLEQETKYLPMGGETCALAPPYSDCEFATEELERFHWSYLNIGYNRDVLDEWDNQGCFDEVERRLGYRFRLLSSTVATESKPGGSIDVNIKMINEGYSSPYNPRKFEVILRNAETNEEYYLKTEEDPRRWPVKEEFEINFTAGLPEGMTPGNYQLFINLPDPYPLLYGNPAYSIRFANENVWNESLGYNDLGIQISVNRENTSETYSGDTFFDLRSAKNTIEIEGSKAIFGGSDESSILVFWGRQNGFERIIERSTDGSTFEKIAAISSELDFFKDPDVEQGSTYSYRYFLTQEDNKTNYSDTITLSPTTATDHFPEIIIDGEDEDWGTIPPISSATSPESYSLRNYFDEKKANFILYGPIDDYQIYLNTDNDTETGSSATPTIGMDYLIRNDSLFVFVENEWAYTEEQTETASGENLLEFSISHTLFENIDFNPSIIIYALINDGNVLLAETDGSPAVSVRMPPPDLPSSFTVSNSEESDTQLVLEWEKCRYCLGYRIERSEDGTSFQEIGEFESTTTEVNDDNLINEKTYYYRLFTYNEIGSSKYTDVVEVTVNQNPPLSVRIDTEKTPILYPNPSNGYLIIEFDYQKIEIYNLQGKMVFSEEAKTNKMDINGLGNGLFILRAYTINGVKNIKFIKK